MAGGGKGGMLFIQRTFHSPSDPLRKISDSSCMKCIILKTGQPVSVDDDIYDLLNQWTWVLHRDGYAVRYTTSKGKRQTIYMHNVVAGAKGIDHIDGDKLNNQRYNLRACTQRQNRFNA